MSFVKAIFIVLLFSTAAYAESDVYGVIEVGSKGIKGVVIQLLPKAGEEGVGMEVREELKPENKTPILPSATDDAANAVSAIFGQITQKFTIPNDHVFIYGSSGVAQNPNKSELATKIKEKTGRELDFIAVEQEAQFAFDGVVPLGRRNQVAFIDIGGGNIKGGYLEQPEGKLNTFEIPLGTAAFEKQINDSRGETPFLEKAEALRVEALTPKIRETSEKKPGLINLKRVYLAGGISFALSTLTRPEQRNAFSRLSSEDIITFYNRATRNPDILFKPDLNKITNATTKSEVDADIKKIQSGMYSLNGYIAGAEILKALSTELDFKQKDAIFFAKNAMQAIPLGYLHKMLENPAKKQSEEDKI